MMEVIKLPNLLKNGWEIENYSANMAAAGALIHSILMRKGTDLTCVTVVTQGNEETGRNVIAISPRPERKKGFFG